MSEINSMIPTLPQVRAYHPRIGVKGKDGQVSVIRADLSDFASDDEVLEMMGQALQVETAGEVVEAIAGGERKHCLGSVGCLNCSVEHVALAVGEGVPTVNWDHKVV